VGTTGLAFLAAARFVHYTLDSVLLRAALSGFIDYAGLFPPAGLDLATSVANHDGYARLPERWMLGRLVVPLARLGELTAILSRTPGERDWSVSALMTATDPFDAAELSLARFVALRHSGVAVTAVEAALPDLASVARLSAATPNGLERFIEIPLDETRDAWLDAVGAAGCHAKIRTGGVTGDRFPSPATLASVLAACARRHLPLKATAGLHHPMRNAYRLTYEPDSPTGMMHGFVNLLVAALVLQSGAGGEDDAVRALQTRDACEFALHPDAIRWDGWSFDRSACQDTRAHLLRSVGSCSFEEPVTELRALGWL
jgi:hypothetical protein